MSHINKPENSEQNCNQYKVVAFTDRTRLYSRGFGHDDIHKVEDMHYSITMSSAFRIQEVIMGA